MADEPNPYIEAQRTARRIAQQGAPFYATVVTIVGNEVEVKPRQQGSSLGLCKASKIVISTPVVVGDTVACLWIEGRAFVVAIVAP